MPNLEPKKSSDEKLQAIADSPDVQQNLKINHNLMKIVKNSPPVLQALKACNIALDKGQLSDKLREKIALTVAQVNKCKNCLDTHMAIGREVGLSEENILEGRLGISTNPKEAATLRFSQKIVERGGILSEKDVISLRNAGVDDAIIVEIIANITLNIFSNYLSHAFYPKKDFQKDNALG